MGFHAAGRPRLVIDLETYSEVDLAKAGPHAYAEHPSTDVHCVAWRIKGGMADCGGLWLPGQPVPGPVILHVTGQCDRIVAHNYLFEWNLWGLVLAQRHGWPLPAFKQWSCTMARALYHGLPASLETLGQALGLAHTKDPTARRNMLKLCKPRAYGPEGKAIWWKDDPAAGPGMLKNLYAYCLRDVETECDADDALPELPERERRVFLMDGEVNQRGVGIDLELIEKLDLITQGEGVRLNQDMAAATGGQVKTAAQVGALAAWLDANGPPVPALDKAGVATALLTANDVTRPALLCRREGAKASTAKLKSMRAAASCDRRARGMFQYYGAGRTGRWAGRRAQFQNYPRPTLKQNLVDLAVRWARMGRTADDYRVMFPGTPMDVVASCLRACLVPAPGRVLGSVDLSQIEARVVAWLAGQQDILDVFASGEDVYTYTAGKIGSNDRQMGKVLVLACGFGMGPDKFLATAALYGIKLDLDQAKELVYGWRRANAKIEAFWYALGEAFRRVALGPRGMAERVGHLVLQKAGKAVRIVLPSGRHLVYQDVQILQDDAGRPEITYMGVHQLTRQWDRLRTYGGKLAENATQAVARDVMADALLELHDRDVPVVGSIHDEALFESEPDEMPATFAFALRAFQRTPKWAPGLPVGAAGWVGDCYRKG